MREGMIRVVAQVVLVAFLSLSLSTCGDSTVPPDATAPAPPAPDTAAPAAPTGVTATAGNGKATVAWTAVSGATSYNVYWSTTAGVTPANGTKMAGVVSPYDKTGLDNGTMYYFVVTAVNANGESAASSPASATPGFVPPAAASGLGTLGELPKSAPTPLGTTDNAAAVLAKQVLAGDAGSLPALLRAIDLAGFTIQHDGVTVQAPSGVSQGIAFQAWEVQAIDKLMRDRLVISFGEVAALFASTTTETASIPFETLMYEGIRTNATGTNPALRFWAQFIIELGWQGPYAYDLMIDNTLTNVTVDAVQTAFIFKRLSGDLAAFANNHSPTPLKARSLRTGVRAAGTASSPCTTEGIKQEIMDWNAAGINFGFGEFLTYLENGGLGAAGKLGKIAGISNLALTYLKLVATKAMFNAKVEMDGGPPLTRTKSTSTHGERRTLTATVTMDDTNAQWVNCLRPAINAMGLDFDLPHAGPVPGAEVNWVLVRPRPKVLAGGGVDHGIVQFVGGDPVHAAGNITNDLGQSTFDIEGVRQPKAVSPTAEEVRKEATVYAHVILKPANMYQDIKDAVTNSGFSYFNFGSLDGLITLPAELMYRTRWMFGQGFEFEVIDWSQGFTGSIIISEKGKKTETRLYTNIKTSGSYEDRRTLDITGSVVMIPYTPEIGFAYAELDGMINTDSTERFTYSEPGREWTCCNQGAASTIWSRSAVRPMDPIDICPQVMLEEQYYREELSLTDTTTQLGNSNVTVQIHPDGQYKISINLAPQTLPGSFSSKKYTNDRCSPANTTSGAIDSTTRHMFLTVKGNLDPSNPRRLKGTITKENFSVRTGRESPNSLYVDTAITIEWDLAI